MIDNDTRKSIEGIMNRLPCIDSAVLPSLTLIQEHNGYVSESDMEELALILKFPQARIFSVASFYSMLSLKPRGKYHLQVCTNVSCSVVQKESLFDYLSEKMGIREGDISPDGLFSIEAVECLGSCGYARAMLINNDHFENLNFEGADEIIDSIRKKEGIK